jgi:sugar lactone lactonase YvrE
VLLANAKANEIYSYQIVGNRLTQGSSLVSLPQSRGLASIALDADNKRLFVSDSQGSTIYAVDLQTRKSSVFAQGFSQVKALAVDARRGRLCIAAGHRVLALPLAGAAAPEVVREGLKLSSGIALDGNGRIWVSDFASGSVIGPI